MKHTTVTIKTKGHSPVFEEVDARQHIQASLSNRNKLESRQQNSPSPSIPSEFSHSLAQSSRLSYTSQNIKTTLNTPATQRQLVSQQSQHAGSVIGVDFILMQDLGEGTFGSVKLAKQTATGKLVAVKILEKSRIRDQADIERIVREIKILKEIRHDNIVKLFEIVENADKIYLIMEYASGGELFDYIVSRERLSEREACNLYMQVIDGVQYLHKMGVAHRDLKPENLLLDAQNNVKIVDFGLSNRYTPGQTLQTACGSPCYAAPEMIAGKRYNGIDVDIWSSGVTLYAMLVGYLPFEDPDTAQLYKKILVGQFELPSHLSSKAIQALKTIIQVDPLKRVKIEGIRNLPWVQEHSFPDKKIKESKSVQISMNNRTFAALEKSPRSVNSSKKVKKSINQWQPALKVTQEIKQKHLKVGVIDLTRGHSAKKYNSARKPDLMNNSDFKTKMIDLSSIQNRSYLTSTPKLSIHPKISLNKTLNLSSTVKKSELKHVQFGQTTSINGPSPKIRLNIPSTGGSPSIPDQRTNISFKKPVKIATVSLSLNQSYQSATKSVPIRVIRDVMPCPDLILLSNQEECLIKLGQIARILKLELVSKYTYRNKLLEIELCKILDKVYQLRIKKLTEHSNNALDLVMKQLKL